MIYLVNEWKKKNMKRWKSGDVYMELTGIVILLMAIAIAARIKGGK